MNTPYRIPTPPAMPKTRHEWIVLWSEGSDTGLVEVGGAVLLVQAGIVGFIFIVGGLCPTLVRALLVLGISILAWCLAYVRRKPITETNS